jgi:hypothetical protein
MPGAAGAEEKATMGQAANQQAALCNLLGGEGDVETDRTVEGVSKVTSTCKGGLLDDVTCDNYQIITVISTCSGGSGQSATTPVYGWHVMDIVYVLENGSEQQLATMVTELEQEQAAEPRTAAAANADDQDDGRDNGKSKRKGKKGKHGKKGKGRR